MMMIMMPKDKDSRIFSRQIAQQANAAGKESGGA
jgi:hypothetical protein